MAPHDVHVPASEEFAEALDENPTMADILAERGDALVTLGRLDEARADFERALELVPDLPEAVEGLARLEEDR